MLPALIAPAQSRFVGFAEAVAVGSVAGSVASLPVAVPSADNMDSAVRNTSADMLPGNNYCMP